MGITKSELCTREQNEMASWAKLLGHPARIAILQRLLEQDKCCNSLLVEEIGLAQATISQHLRELKLSGLIKGTIEGASMNYCIDVETWQTMAKSLGALLELNPSPSCQNNC
jgi:DNA-binding transcriptional ArsR family regulator